VSKHPEAYYALIGGEHEVYMSWESTYQARPYDGQWAIFETSTMKMLAQRETVKAAVTLMAEWEEDAK
jgi:hypothetical protein